MTTTSRYDFHHRQNGGFSSPSTSSLPMDVDTNGSDDGLSNGNTALQNLPFTKKLFDMLSDCDNREMIAWSKDGLAFEVIDPKGLERDVLPKYFRHSRFQSLVRQLNFYNFKVSLISLSLTSL